MSHAEEDHEAQEYGPPSKRRKQQLQGLSPVLTTLTCRILFHLLLRESRQPLLNVQWQQ